MPDKETEEWIAQQRAESSRRNSTANTDSMTKEESLEWIKQEWPWLIQLQESAFEDACKADEENKPQAEKAILVRRWWSLVNSCLWMFVRTQAQHGHVLEPFPAYLLGRLANLSEETSNGNISEMVTDAKKKGRQWWRAERHHIAYAVLYIEAVKRGEIEDKHPNKTVRQAYDVSPRAVQKWMKRRDEICVGVPLSLGPTHLERKMRECGAIYSRIGRGAPSEN